MPIVPKYKAPSLSVEEALQRSCLILQVRDVWGTPAFGAGDEHPANKDCFYPLTIGVGVDEMYVQKIHEILKEAERVLALPDSPSEMSKALEEICTRLYVQEEYGSLKVFFRDSKTAHHLLVKAGNYYDEGNIRAMEAVLEQSRLALERAGVHVQ